MRESPDTEQMARELIDAGWYTCDFLPTVWVTPDGGILFGTTQAWEVMTRDRARRFDS
jgi:hypothetical protein